MSLSGAAVPSSRYLLCFREAVQAGKVPYEARRFSPALPRRQERQDEVLPPAPSCVRTEGDWK